MRSAGDTWKGARKRESADGERGENMAGKKKIASGDDKARIESDIRQFHENVGEVKENDETRDVIEMAKQYCEDTKYFLEKRDYVTAFGCINYAHGLIDAYRKKWRD